MSIVHTFKSGNKNLPRRFITILSSPRILKLETLVPSSDLLFLRELFSDFVSLKSFLSLAGGKRLKSS